MARILVTGGNGFTGRYLSERLARAGHEVHVLAREFPKVKVPGAFKLHACDLLDAACLRKVLDVVEPEKVAHLAAVAFIAHGDVESMYRTNVLGTRCLLDALASRSEIPSTVLLASSANVYGNATSGALTEDAKVSPANDYAVSKLAMENIGKIFSDRLPIVIGRPFNYTGIGQSVNFLIPKIVDQVRKRAPVIHLGNLDVARDFSDVRSVVEIYSRLLFEKAAIDNTFNICSGIAHTLQDILDLVGSISGHDFSIEVNPSFVRANEVKVLLGDPSKLNSLVGGLPSISLAETLTWMLRA